MSHLHEPRPDIHYATTQSLEKSPRRRHSGFATRGPPRYNSRQPIPERSLMRHCIPLLALAATLVLPGLAAAQDDPFAAHGKLRVAKSGTYLEHADGTPFFFLADTAWTGPALSTAAD